MTGTAKSTSERANRAVRPLIVEFVGIAGVGKSHLVRRLIAALGDRAVDLNAVRPTLRDVRSLPAAIRRAGPLVWHVFRGRGGAGSRLGRVPLRLVAHAWREELVARAAGSREFVLIEEGWFHKLRRLRHFLGHDVTYRDLPRVVRERLFRPDAVVFLTADPLEVCRRKLQRWGVAATPAELARQYARSEALGQWREDAFSRQDLRDAERAIGLEVVEIDYGDGYDVTRDLIPLLEGIARP